MSQDLPMHHPLQSLVRDEDGAILLLRYEAVDAGTPSEASS